MEAVLHGLVGAQARRAFDRLEINGRDKTDGADVFHQRMALQREGRIGPYGFELLGILEQLFVAVQIHAGNAGGSRHWVAGIGVAMEQLDHVIGAVHELVVDALAHQAAAHRHGARGDALGEGQDIRRDTEALRGEGMAQAPEAGDDLVENQQDAVLVADLAEPLEIALGRRQHAGRTGHRLDDDGGNGRSIVQRHHALEVVRQMRAPFRLATAEGLFLAVVGVRQVIDAGQHGAEPLAVGDHAADRDAAEVHAVIAALAADEAGAGALATGAMIGQRDLQRSVGGFRTRVAEEGIVQVARGHGGKARRQLEHLRVAELEGRREVEFGGGFLDGLDDGATAMPGIGAPQARRTIENGAARHVVIVHVLGAGDHAGLLLEGAVGREAHPERFKVVGRRLPRCGSGQVHRLVHVIGLLGTMTPDSRKPCHEEMHHLCTIPGARWEPRARVLGSRLQCRVQAGYCQHGMEQAAKINTGESSS